MIKIMAANKDFDYLFSHTDAGLMMEVKDNKSIGLIRKYTHIFTYDFIDGAAVDMEGLIAIHLVEVIRKMNS